MAKSTHRAEVTTVTSPEAFVLELTRDEAETLAVILFRIGGYPDDTPRGHADQISKALRALEIRGSEENPKFANLQPNDHLWFSTDESVRLQVEAEAERQAHFDRERDEDHRESVWF